MTLRPLPYAGFPTPYGSRGPYRTAAGGGVAVDTGPQPDFADVTLLIGSNGTVGLQDMVDEKAVPQTLTWSGTAVVSKDIADPWGGSTPLLKQSAIGDYIDYGARTDLDWGNADDRTMELWLYTLGLTTSHPLFDMRDTGNAEEFSMFVSGSDSKVYQRTFNGTGVRYEVSGGAWTGATWHHIYVQRKSLVVGIWLDGIYLDGVTQTLAPASNISNMQMGRIRFSPGVHFPHGYRTEMRCHKGVPLQTNGVNFTPPTGIFPRS